MDTARIYLQNELGRRKARNPAYSLRAFAQTLGIPSGRLSEILSAKRSLSPKMLNQIVERLGLSPALRREWMASVEATSDGDAGEMHSLPEDEFQAIADGVHFSLLSLMETDDFRMDLRWISKRLGISQPETRSALERLLRLGLARENRGTLEPTHAGLTTTHDVSSASLRAAHAQALRRALDALETVAVEERDITSITIASDPAKLPEAKRMIRSFRRKLARLLESGEQTEVYQFNLQLIPVTRGRSNERGSA